ncbi:MAG TPA: type 1 glutamine amidotransferase [Gaiellaceae bacterium]|nr:type 1 glutamine amidotransferase [Gaiellaceae bacterium]
MDVLVLQHIACEPPGVYEDVLRERGAALTQVEVDAGDELPDWREFSAIVAMGGPMSANDDDTLPWLADEKALIADAVRAGMPFWGVCLGVQLLAASLGARVYAGDEPEVGVLAVELTEEGRADPVFSALPRSVPALQWHGDTFDLPPGAVRLAGSPAYPNQAFRFENAYGVQFHLEVSSEMAREWMDVPEYANALEQTIGGETMLRAVDERVDEMLEHGRTLFARWLDSVVRTSPFNAVRLEA